MVRRTAEVAIGDVHVAQQKKRKSNISAILLVITQFRLGDPRWLSAHTYAATADTWSGVS